ncbi:LuxR C-terminal-related transcriptional regulator [Streptomyces sp. NPDC058457]|uniref:helix-turn-helix transcriptional regulator n=1 Tax=Streptomyces sp. NPDC058457 TaxID=3346507 RepID=UPI0036595C9B
MRSIVPYDTGSWMITDPDTLLPASILSVDATPALRRAFTELELDGGDDVNTFDALSRAAQPVASLSQTTDGNLVASRRYREVHRRFGLGDELRAVARSSNATWGMGCVNRADDVPDFSAEEVRFVTAIAKHLGVGLRKALARRQADPDPLRAPGVLVLDEHMNIEASTGQAQRWLNTLQPTLGGGLPTPIETVALQAQINAARESTQRPARLRLQVPGGWLLVHADALKATGAAPLRVAVVLEPAGRAELMPLLLALHGLTERERYITELLVEGLGTDEIATRLCISRHTLRDYVKTIFGKVGVCSRPELTAALAQQPLAA